MNKSDVIVADYSQYDTYRYIDEMLEARGLKYTITQLEETLKNNYWSFEGLQKIKKYLDKRKKEELILLWIDK